MPVSRTLPRHRCSRRKSPCMRRCGHRRRGIRESPGVAVIRLTRRVDASAGVRSWPAQRPALDPVGSSTEHVPKRPNTRSAQRRPDDAPVNGALTHRAAEMERSDVIKATMAALRPRVPCDILRLPVFPSKYLVWLGLGIAAINGKVGRAARNGKVYYRSCEKRMAVPRGLNSSPRKGRGAWDRAASHSDSLFALLFGLLFRFHLNHTHLSPHFLSPPCLRLSIFDSAFESPSPPMSGFRWMPSGVDALDARYRYGMRSKMMYLDTS
jgi:hypothetical protein